MELGTAQPKLVFLSDQLLGYMLSYDIYHVVNPMLMTCPFFIYLFAAFTFLGQCVATLEGVVEQYNAYDTNYLVRPSVRILGVLPDQCLRYMISCLTID